MKTILSFLVALSFSLTSISQIITEVSSLPDVGDVLSYKGLSSISESYLVSGSDVTWDFTGMMGNDILLEQYFAADEGEVFDQFPGTDLLVNFSGIEAYANRNTTNIEVVGVSLGDFVQDVEFPLGQTLDEPYVIRRAPIGFGDSFSGSTSFFVNIGGAALAPLTGAIGEILGDQTSVDSLRIQFNFSRTEEVDSYGTAVFGNGSTEVLRLVQTDELDFNIELYVVTGFLDSWINVTELVDAEEFGLDTQSLTNYLFLDATSKEHILEVNVNNTDGSSTGRYKSTFVNSVDETSTYGTSVYPNPATDIVNIKSRNLTQVTVINDLGQSMEISPVYIASGAQLNLTGLSTGVYTVISESKDGSIRTTRLIKQ